MLYPRRLALMLTLALSWVLPGCASHWAVPGPAIEAAHEATDAFVMPDGMRLPYRSWLPKTEPWAVMLALHGMNDSRDAWEIPAPDFADAGIAVFSPDQRGFGDTAARGYWPGTAALVDDARHMAALLHARYPHARLILTGESMGAAELMCLTRRDQAVWIQDHHLDAGLTMKRGGHRRTGIAGSGDENGERSFVCARKTAHAGGEEARADILERGSGAVEQLKHVPVVLWQRA